MRFCTTCSFVLLVTLSFTPTQGQDVQEILNVVGPTVLQAYEIAKPLVEDPQVLQLVLTNIVDPIVENRAEIEKVAMGAAQTALLTVSAVADSLIQAIDDAQQTEPPATVAPVTEPPFDPKSGY